MMHSSAVSASSPLAPERSFTPTLARAQLQPASDGVSTPPAPGCCFPCGRRRLLGASAASALQLPISPSEASADPNEVMERLHPARPDWYEKLYARALEKCMKSYEAEVAGYKAELFSHLTGEGKKVLEFGVGTGHNFKYYARAADLEVIGVDPNKQMEKYARAAAVDAGLPLTHFSFKRGVVEALPVEDETVDAVIGTLVMCSVSDVDLALKEVKRVLKPGALYFFIEHVAARGISQKPLAGFPERPS